MSAPLSASDFKKLRGSLLLFVVMAIVGAVAVSQSIQYANEAKRAKMQAEAARNDARSKLARARDEEQELREKIARYAMLTQKGILGQEHRLDWVEKIRSIKQSRKLIGLEYELAPQHPIDSAVVSATGPGFEIMASAMKLQMQLLHEDDLLGFMTDLRNEVQAYIRARSCIIGRIPQGTTRERGATAQLHAECELDWITIREKS